MEWSTVVLISVVSVCVCVAFLSFIEKAYCTENDDSVIRLETQVDILKGEIAQRDRDIALQRERGDRHTRGRDSSDDKLAALQTIFADIVKEAGKVENMKALLEAGWKKNS